MDLLEQTAHLLNWLGSSGDAALEDNRFRLCGILFPRTTVLHGHRRLGRCGAASTGGQQRFHAHGLSGARAAMRMLLIDSILAGWIEARTYLVSPSTSILWTPKKCYETMISGERHRLKVHETIE